MKHPKIIYEKHGLANSASRDFLLRAMGDESDVMERSEAIFRRERPDREEMEITSSYEARHTRVDDDDEDIELILQSWRRAMPVIRLPDAPPRDALIIASALSEYEATERIPSAVVLVYDKHGRSIWKRNLGSIMYGPLQAVRVGGEPENWYRIDQALKSTGSSLFKFLSKNGFYENKGMLPEAEELKALGERADAIEIDEFDPDIRAIPPEEWDF